METQRDFLCVRMPATLRFESAGDYSLPDYNTDVRRVLETKVEVVDSACFVNGDGADVSGTVNYAERHPAARRADTTGRMPWP